MKRTLTAALALAILPVTGALGVGTSRWTHTTEADFNAGTFKETVATNLGDLKLSRSVKTLLGQDARISAVHSLAQAPDGTIYAGTGPQGVLLQIKDDKVSDAAVLEGDTSIFSLGFDKEGRLLIGTGGEKGRVLRLDKPGDKPTEIFAHEGVQYVWSIFTADDGTTFVATGPTGELYSIDPDGKAEVAFKCNQTNLLALTGDGKDVLYVGTDPEGLVYRFNRKSKEAFVLYDATEREVSSLVLDKAGNLYAATAEATPDESAVTDHEGASDAVGRPEMNADTVEPIPPADEPKLPPPTEQPVPDPGDPHPIPKNSEPKADAFLPRPVLRERVGVRADGFASAKTPHPSPLPAYQERGQEIYFLMRSPDELDDGPVLGLGDKKNSAGHRAPPRAANVPSVPAADGNAVYKIDPVGFVTEIFRQPVTVYGLLEQNGVLLAAASDGLVYQINPASEETVVVAKVESKEVLALLPTKDGRVFMGLANSGELASMSAGFAPAGTYTSPVLDATQISRFGKMRLHGSLPPGTKLSVAMRSGNVEETTGDGWSNWSAEQSASVLLPVTSPTARFFQYRLTFSGDNSSRETPIVSDVEVAYQMPNLAPKIASVVVAKSTSVESVATDTTAARSNHPAASPVVSINWTATDENEDALEYAVYYRSGSKSPWILLSDKLTDATCDWDTRGVADGRYEVRVTASDNAANALGEGRTVSRMSEAVVVDNTAPYFGKITQTTAANASVKLEFVVADAGSSVALLEYSVNSSKDWQTVLPSDMIADSPEERYEFTVSGLKAGATNQIALRATDEHGNTAHSSLTVNIPAATARGE